MKLKIITVLLMAICLFGIASAEITTYAPVKQNDCIILKQTCASCSYVNVSISYPNSTLSITNDGTIEAGGGVWTYEFCNTTQLGRYDVSGIGDILGVATGFDTLYFYVNYNGEDKPDGLGGRFMLILFFVGLIIILILIKRNTDFDKWYRSILKKYEHRNFFRTFVSSIGYFFMNNPFSLFYMIGLFIMLIIYDITKAYVLTSIYPMMQIFVGIYFFGLLLIALEVFGDIQEFFVKIMDDFKGLGWGLEHD